MQAGQKMFCVRISLERGFCLLLLAINLLLSGCASVPMAAIGEENEAKTFSIKSDTAKVYVYRTSSFTGSAVALQVSVDGRIVGTTGVGTFLMFELPPGVHKIASYAVDGTRSLKLEVEAGKLYFIKQNRQMSHSLTQVAEAEGKQEVIKCRLAQTD
jgi:hypothetical protein